MKIIDAHSHIDYITHKKQSDVCGTICSCTRESDWEKLIELIKNDDCVYGAFGIHPWFVGDTENGFENRLCNLLMQNDSFMVGEIGLDKYKPDMDRQIEIFVAQLKIASELNRPVFLHCVGAWERVLCILKQYKNLPLIIVHDFNGSIEILNNLTKHYNVMFSFHRIDSEIIALTDTDKILVETDADANVVLSDVVNKIAFVKKDDNISNIIYENTQRVLHNG